MVKKILVAVVLLIATSSTVFASSDTELSPLEVAPANQKLVALTFDDGPHFKYTPMLLNILAKYNAKATFFVIGDRIVYSEDLLKRMSAEGHDIGNHTYSHKELTKLNNKEIQNEIEKANDKIKEITGEKPMIIRPPGGIHSKKSDEIIARAGQSIIMWNIDPKDWKFQNSERIYKQIIGKVQPGDIILLHDFYDSTVEAVDMILKTLTEDGYTFVKVTDLLKQNENLIPGHIYYKGD